MNIRLLCDAGIPKIELYEMPAGVAVVPWRGNDSTDDEELIEVAATSGYDGVVFMSGIVLHREEVRELAETHDIAVIAVSSDDPLEAKLRIIDCAPRIPGLLADGARLIALKRPGPTEFHPDPQTEEPDTPIEEAE